MITASLFLSLALTAQPAATSPTAAEFVSAVRDGSTTWLLTKSGKLFTQQGPSAPREHSRFSNKGKPFVWHKPPTSMTRWRNEWWIADGGTALHRFSATGEFRGTTALPARATDVVSGQNRLWIYGALPGGRFWISSDGAKFTRIETPVVSEDEMTPAQAGIAAILVMAPAGDDILYAHLIGEPRLYRMTPAGRKTSSGVAYQRSARRARLTVAQTNIPQEQYSAPIRDILVGRTGEIVVLRNWEDVPGQKERWVGRRADSYDAASGKHLHTTTFAEPVRWLLRKESGKLVVMARSGRILTAPAGRAIPGAVIP